MVQSEGNTAQLQRLLDRAAEGNDDAHEELITKASERLLKLTRKMLRGYPHLRRWEHEGSGVGQLRHFEKDRRRRNGSRVQGSAHKDEATRCLESPT